MPEPIDPLSPPPAGTASKPGGIDAMMAQLDAAAVAAPAAPEPKADPAAAPRPPEGGAPAKTPEPPKPATTPPQPKPGEPEMSVEDMEKFLKAHSNKKPWKVYESLKTTTATKVAELESKLAALERKPVESPGDPERIAKLEKQIESLSGETKTYKERLAASNFENTPKHAEFLAKANRIWSRAVQSISGITVMEPDGGSHPATKDDFDTIRVLPPGARRNAARMMFPEDSAEVLAFASQLDMIKEENDEAKEVFVKTHEQSSLQEELESKGQEAKFQSIYQASMEAIKKNAVWGKWFSPDEKDPEATKLLNDGYDEVEKISKLSDDLPPEDAAAYAAVFRSRAAVTPRMLLEINRLGAKVTALEEELSKYRATDPGAIRPGGGADAVENKPKGIDGAAMAFDADPGLVNRR